MTLAPTLIGYVRDYVQRGGPTEREWDDFSNYLSSLATMVNNKQVPDPELNAVRNYLRSTFSTSCMQGFALTKPYGYAGDYEIIDRIYTNYLSTETNYINWDRYFQASAAPKAVRNRKSYFKDLVAARSLPPHKVLNVASGPCRDVLELFEENPNINVSIDCVEADERAITYAKRLTHRHAHRINFIHNNVFKFTTENRYDLIWSAGLFDYFDDRAFALCLRRLLTFVKPGGEIVIGNFSTENPSRPYMEIFGEWFLHHRSANDLVRLAESAGVRRNDIDVGREEEGVNLFLHIRLNSNV